MIRRRWVRTTLVALAAAGIWLFVALMVTIIVTIAIWPGEAKLTAPLLCPDHQPDPFVVSDVYQPTPGETSTTYTLYCMGPGGDRTDVGFFRPMLILTFAHGLLLTALIGLPIVITRALRGRAPTR